MRDMLKANELYMRLVKFPVKSDSSEVAASGTGGIRGEMALLAT